MVNQDFLDLWREEGLRQIPQNFEVFRSLVAQTRDFTEQGKYDVAAVYDKNSSFLCRLQTLLVFLLVQN